MHHLQLPGGAQMPALGLGTWLSTKGEVQRAVRAAIEIGYRHIDGAFIYQNEKEVGAGIREAISAGLCTREELFVTTKLWNDAHAPADVLPALERSLGTDGLDLDYIDLYLVHWPVAHRRGVLRPTTPDEFLPLSEMPLEATWEAMAALSETGRCRQVGVSNFSLPQIDTITNAVGLAPAVDQIELHPYLAQPQLLAGLRERKIVATAYCPLGSAGRPDTMRRPDEARLLDDPTVVGIAEEADVSAAQVLLAWGIARGSAVIPKSTNPARLAENFAASDLELDSSQLDAIDHLDRGERYVTGDFWCPPGSPYSLEGLWGPPPSTKG